MACDTHTHTHKLEMSVVSMCSQGGRSIPFDHLSFNLVGASRDRPRPVADQRIESIGLVSECAMEWNAIRWNAMQWNGAMKRDCRRRGSHCNTMQWNAMVPCDAMRLTVMSGRGTRDRGQAARDARARLAARRRDDRAPRQRPVVRSCSVLFLVCSVLFCSVLF